MKHLEALFEMYPFLKLLTGDALYAQRPLLEALQKYHCDYLFQVRENLPKILAKMKVLFNDAEHQKPDDVLPRKKRGTQIVHHNNVAFLKRW